MRVSCLFAIATLAACESATTASAASDTAVDTNASVDTNAAVDTNVVPETQNTWFIDDEEHPALYASLNCEMNDTKLRLSAADTGGVGSIQLVLGARPTANTTLTVVNPTDLSTIGAGEIVVSIGRDREQENQYKATSGSVSVTVVTTDPQEIHLSFADLPSTTKAGASAKLSGNVGARDGAFLGACHFEDL